jgi:hypothetical protein
VGEKNNHPLGRRMAIEPCSAQHVFDGTARYVLLQPLTEAVETAIRHRKAIEVRWQSQYSTARLEGCYNIFLAARAGARGYRNAKTFIAMIILLGSPLGNLINST